MFQFFISQASKKHDRITKGLNNKGARINLVNAQIINDAICSHFELPQIKVIFEQKDRICKSGACERILWFICGIKKAAVRVCLGEANPHRRLIVLYPAGQTIGTLIHEIAHICSPFSFHGRGWMEAFGYLVEWFNKNVRVKQQT